MALPTTNLRLHCDGSDTDNVFTTWDSGGAHSGVPGDGALVEVWDDEDDGIADIALVYGGKANYRSSTPLMQLPCLDFDGEQYLQTYNQAGSVFRPLSDLITASACTLAFAIYVEAAGLNNASPYANHIIFGDNGLFFSLGVRSDGGSGAYIQFYNWDGNEDYVEKAISLNTSYVVIAKHDGGNLTLTVITDGSGSESSATPVASGDTTTITGINYIGTNGTGSYDGRIGEFAIYNAALSGSNLTDLKQYFYSKWFPAAVVERRWILGRH